MTKVYVNKQLYRKHNNIILIITINHVSDLKLIDWQMCSGALPIVDIANIVLYTTDPKLVEDNLEEMLESYQKTFVETCAKLKVRPPFTLEDLTEEFNTKGYVLIFAMTVFFYEPLRNAFGTPMIKRMMWIVEKCLMYNSELFE